MNPSVLVISGSMGAGKTTVMGEASDVLIARGVRHAAIDLDAISLQLVPEPISRETQLSNFSAVATNCRNAGIDRFLVAAAVESREFLADLRTAFGAAEITIARVIAPVETMETRLRIREPGIRQREFVERSRTLDVALTKAALEDFTVSNIERPITEVAQELLERVGWI